MRGLNEIIEINPEDKIESLVFAQSRFRNWKHTQELWKWQFFRFLYNLHRKLPWIICLH